MAARMVELGSSYSGLLGIESVRGADGLGITVSYWKDEASIRAWKRDEEHQKRPARRERNRGTSTTRCALRRWSGSLRETGRSLDRMNKWDRMGSDSEHGVTSTGCFHGSE